MSNSRFLRERGKEIWAAFNADQLPAGQRALVHEAARLADTLDKLDAILGQRQADWAKIVIDELGEITLQVDGLLGERRQNALAFNTIMKEIRTAGIKETTGSQPQPEEGGRDALILRLQRNAG